MVNFMSIMFNDRMPTDFITPDLLILDDIICLASCSISFFVWSDAYRNYSIRCRRCHRFHSLGLYTSNYGELHVVVNFNDFRLGLADGCELYAGYDVTDDDSLLTIEADWDEFIKFRNWQISHFGGEWLAMHRVYF